MTDNDRPYVPGRVVVKFRTPPAAVASVGDSVALAGADFPVLVASPLAPDVAVLGLPAVAGVGETPSIAEAIQLLSADPAVEWAEPDYYLQLMTVPNDPGYSQLWGMNRVKAPQAWDKITSTPVTVAVIDTGIAVTHPDLAANMWVNQAEKTGTAGVDDDGNQYVDDIHGWNFLNVPAGDKDIYDGNGHGSHCAGTIGAVGNNGKGVAGVSWGVKLMALRIFNSQGLGSGAGQYYALLYAIKMGAKVVSNSYAGGSSRLMAEAVEAARQAGVIMVCAAGNSSFDNDTPFGNAAFPATYPHDNVVSVASIDQGDRLSWFSNYGKTTVDIAAPGENILSTVPPEGYATKSGTSMACPHVAGACALVWGANPSWTYRQVIDQVLNTAEVVPSLVGRIKTGGVLDVARAVGYVPLPPPPPLPPPITTVVVDDSSPTFTKGQGWTYQPNPQGYPYYGGTHHYKDGRSGGTAPCAWTFPNLNPGRYRVGAYYVPYSNRATNALYVVTDGNGNKLASREVNQQVGPNDFQHGGLGWVLVGEFDVAAAGNLVVSLSGEGNQYLIADAVCLGVLSGPGPDPEPEPPLSVVVDDTSPGMFTKGADWVYWPNPQGYPYHAGTHHYKYGPTGSDSPCVWTPPALPPGRYRIGVYYVPYSNRATDAKYTVRDGVGNVLAEKTVNQQLPPGDFQAGGKGWAELGEVVLAQKTDVSVLLSGRGNQYLIADAVRFDEVPA